MDTLFRRLVVNIPHASTVIPEDVRDDLVLAEDRLQSELLLMTDHFTDELFGVADPRIDVIQYPVSRLVIDPERFPEDEQEAMAAVGMGAVYTNTADGGPLRSDQLSVPRDQLFDRFYRPHHQRFGEAVDAALDEGEVLIIDGHSYPQRPLPYEQGPPGERGQVCIGTDRFHTPAAVVEQLKSHFSRCGYSVSIDTPFAGSIVPLKHYGKTARVKSVMIELRRDIYMDEANGQRSSSFSRVKQQVAAALSGLLNDEPG